MIIRRSESKLTLYRYGGVSEGKNLEVRIGWVPMGTSPDAIPQELLEDLTPKELKLLKEALEADLRKAMAQLVTTVAAELNDLSSALESGLLEPESTVDLHRAASGFLKLCRRVSPKARPVIGVSESP